MQQDHPHYHKPEPQTPWWKTPLGIGAIFFFAVAGYFLAREHSAHIGNNLIWLVLLACPLMHMFMHGGHGGHGGHRHDVDDPDRRKED